MSLTAPLAPGFQTPQVATLLISESDSLGYPHSPLPGSETRSVGGETIVNKDNGCTWRSGEKFKHPLERKNDPWKNDPWKNCHERVKRYDRALCKRWTEEINNLLILSGLFSAIVTAFTIQSYKWLQPDTQSLSYLALLRISNQLSANPSNLTERVAFVPPVSQPTGWQVNVNIVWFLSLILSVTTAMIGIIIIQWIREYERDVYLAPKEALAYRQMIHEGLEKWQVRKILSALPLLLQIALVLFFVGLILMLWNINHKVAAAAGAFVALTFIFIVFTTVIPTLQFLIPLDSKLRVPQCPYKSLQSWAFFRLVSALVWLLSACVAPLCAKLVEHFMDLCRSVTAPRHSSSPDTEDTSSLDPEHPIPISGQRQNTADSKESAVRYTKMWPFLWWWHEYNMWNIPSWEVFDLYWRSIRDRIDSKDKDADPWHAHYDTIRGLVWVNKKIALGVDATYVLHPCLLDLDFPVAVHALRKLSRVPKEINDSESSPLIDNRILNIASTPHSGRHEAKAKLDSLKWLDENAGAIAEINPVQKDMMSLLVIRHLNDDVLHREVQNHYVELYFRIQNAGDDARHFLEHNLRHPPSGRKLHICNVSEAVYIHEMLRQFDFDVSDETVIQILSFIYADVRSARNDSNTGLWHSDASTHLWRMWKVMQPVWKAFVSLLKRTRDRQNRYPYSDASNPLVYCFLLCEEMEWYRDKFHGSKYNEELYNSLAKGLSMLFESVTSDELDIYKSYSGFGELQDLEEAADKFFSKQRFIATKDAGARTLRRRKVTNDHYRSHSWTSLTRRTSASPYKESTHVEIPKEDTRSGLGNEGTTSATTV